MAALTTQSQATAASSAATSFSVAAAITQLNNNQQAMMQQMIAYAKTNTMHNPPAVNNPLLTHCNIPTIGSFQPGGNTGGSRRLGCGCGVCAPVIVPSRRRTPCTPFADYTARQGGMGWSIVPTFVLGVPGGIAAAQNDTRMYPNFTRPKNFTRKINSFYNSNIWHLRNNKFVCFVF